MLTLTIKDPTALSMGLPTSGGHTPRKHTIILPPQGEQWLFFVCPFPSERF